MFSERAINRRNSDASKELRSATYSERLQRWSSLSYISSRSVVEGHEERRRSGIHRGDRGQSTFRADGIKRNAVASVIIDRQKRTRRIDDDATERENACCDGRP